MSVAKGPYVGGIARNFSKSNRLHRGESSDFFKVPQVIWRGKLEISKIGKICKKYEAKIKGNIKERDEGKLRNMKEK